MIDSNPLDEMSLNEVLAHFGVKGMHWGVQRDHSSAPSTSQTRRTELAKVQKKISKIDGQHAVNGYELRGWALKKQYKKAQKRDPNFSYGKLSPEQRQVYQRKASHKVTRSVATRGTVEVGVLLATAFGVSKMSSLSPEAKLGAEIGTILIAGQIGKTRIGDLRDIHTASKLDELHRRRDQLTITKPASA